MKTRIWLILLGLLVNAQLMADAQEEILAADRAFAALSKEKGALAAFAAYAADDAVLYRPKQEPIEGRDALIAVMETDPEGTLEWMPKTVTAAASGDLGFTRGTFVYRPAAGPGAIGWYVSIWQRQAGGDWKFVFDSGIATGPAPALDKQP